MISLSEDVYIFLIILEVFSHVTKVTSLLCDMPVFGAVAPSICASCDGVLYFGILWPCMAC